MSLKSKYYDYQYDSIKFIRETLVSSQDNKISLPSLDYLNCDMRINSTECINITKSMNIYFNNKDFRKYDYSYLPIFKNYMYELLSDKLLFNKRKYEENNKDEIDTSEFYSVGEINSVEKFLNIGSVSNIEYNNEYNNAKNELNSIFKIGIMNFFSISNDEKHLFENTNGLELLAYLNINYICLPIRKCIELARYFFRNHLHYEKHLYEQELQLLILHCPQVKQMSSLLAMTKLDDSGYFEFINNHHSEQSFNFEAINEITIHECLKYSVEGESEKDLIDVENGEELTPESKPELMPQSRTESKSMLLMPIKPKFERENNSQTQTEQTASSQHETPKEMKQNKMQTNYLMKSNDEYSKFQNNKIGEFRHDTYKVPKYNMNHSPNTSLNYDRSFEFKDDFRHKTYNTTYNSDNNGNRTVLSNRKGRNLHENHLTSGQFIDIEVIGPINNVDIIFIVDRASRFVKYFAADPSISSPDQAIKPISQINSMIKISGYEIESICFSDPSFDDSISLKNFARQNRIKLRYSLTRCRYALKLAENLLSSARDYLQGTNVPFDYWTYAFGHAVFLYNQRHEPNNERPRIGVLCPTMHVKTTERLPFGCYAKTNHGEGSFFGYAHNPKIIFIKYSIDDRIVRVQRYLYDIDYFPLLDKPPPVPPIYEDFQILLEPSLINV